MSGPAPTSFPNEQQLAQTALERVRAIFKGNGVKGDSIKILSQKIAHYTMNAGTYLELRPGSSERNVPGKISVGQMVASREEAAKQVDQAMVKAAGDAASRAQIADVLLRRPDQGFGLPQQTLPIDFLKKEFTWHEGCQTCRGTAQAPCPRCQGRRVEPCIKCSGRGLMPCPLCRTTGLLQGNKCTRCFGHRYVPCDSCQKSGMMKCRVCAASGVTKCTMCNGQGWKSYTLTLATQALTYFEYDPKSIPKGAADMIETQGAVLVRDGKIKVKGRIADDKPNALGASYEVTFPYGEIIVQVGKKEVKANIFGHKADITEFPYILDKVLAPAVEDLEEAAKNIGSVAAKIQKATRYRLIAQAFLHASRNSAKKTVEFLMKTYDIGLSAAMAEKIAVLADSTTLHITRKPRFYGLGLGLMASAGISGCYYLLPLRAKIAAYLPDPRLDAVLDILPLLLGGMIATAMIQISAAGAIKKALGHLGRKNQKKMRAPKAGAMAWWGYALTFVIMIGVMEVAANTNASSPYWYEMLRNMIVQKTAGP
jgi:hypothetical protein